MGERTITPAEAERFYDRTGKKLDRYARFEERAGDWHRRQHEQASGGEGTTGPPPG